MLGTAKKLAPPHLPGELRAPVEAGVLLRGGLSGSETGRGTLRGLTHAGLPNPPLARQGCVQALRGPAPRRQEDPPRRPRRQGEQQVAAPAPEAGGLRLGRRGTGEVHLSQMPRPYRHLHEAQRPAEAGRPQEHPGGARVFRGCTRLSWTEAFVNVKGLRSWYICAWHLARPVTAKPGADGPRRPRSSAGGRGGRRRGRRRRGADAPAAGRVRWLMRPGRTTNEGIFTRLGGRARRWGSLLGAPGRFARCTWQFWSSLPSMPIRVSFGPCLVKMSRRALVVVVPAPATSPAPQRRASSPGGWRAGGADRDATNPRGRVRCCRAFCLLAGHHDQSILLTRPRARRRRPALRAPGLAQPSSGEAEAMVAAAAPWLRQDGAGVADFRDGHGRGEPAATPRPPLAGQGRGQPGGGAGAASE